MATIKSYTDISQSKTLSKILPIESADMYWDLLSKDNYAKVNNIGHCLCRTCVYAWSLATLLSVLPRIDIEKEICFDDTYDYRVKAYIGDGYIGDWFDNPVDACVAMIEKLHELKML